MDTVSPESVNDSVGLQTRENVVWNVGEMASVSWNPASLMINELMTIDHVRVDISLLVYSNISEVFEETLMLATNLPNSGSASIPLTASLSSSLPHSDYDLHITIVKVGVNASTTNLARSKRSLPILSKIWGKLAKFAKVRLLSSLKVAIVSRLLCEAWVAATPRFPTRRIPPCPCNEDDAKDDDRFQPEESPRLVRQFFHKKSKSCFRQANVRQVKLNIQ